MKYIIIALLMIGVVNAKPLQSSKGQIAAKNFVIILKYMDKHGCKMQKKINDMAHIYKGAIYRQTSNAVSCATFGKKDDGKKCSIPTTSVLRGNGRDFACVIGIDSLNPGMGL